MNKLLVAISVLLLIVLAISSFFAWQYLSKKNASQDPLPKPQTNNVTKVPTQTSKVKKIAYIKDNSLWVIASDGTSKEQLVQKSNFQLNNLSWKNSEEISFTKCEEATCKIVTRDMVVGTETIEAEAQQALAISWNHAGDKLAYLYRLPDGQMKLDLKTKEGTNTVKNFFASPGRGGSLDDEVSINFSSDDKHILITNTLVAGNPQDKNTIWVLETDSNKEILAIPINDMGWPTQASWQTNNSILYKVGNSLYLRSIDLENSKVLVTVQPEIYNPVSLSDKIYYWSTKEKPLPNKAAFQGPPFIGQIENNNYEKFLDGFYKPQPVDVANLIVLKTRQLDTEVESVADFESSGLSLLNLNTKEVKDLDSGNISVFEVLP